MFGKRSTRGGDLAVAAVADCFGRDVDRSLDRIDDDRVPGALPRGAPGRAARVRPGRLPVGAQGAGDDRPRRPGARAGPRRPARRAPAPDRRRDGGVRRLHRGRPRRRRLLERGLRERRRRARPPPQGAHPARPSAASSSPAATSRPSTRPSAGWGCCSATTRSSPRPRASCPSTAPRSSPRWRPGPPAGRATPAGSGRDVQTRHFNVLDQARAVENQVVWVSANQVGQARPAALPGPGQGGQPGRQRARHHPLAQGPRDRRRGPRRRRERRAHSASLTWATVARMHTRL